MADRYWVGGTGTWNTTSTTNWSASSGGASGASVPTSADDVFFDQASTYTVTCTGALNCRTLTVSAGTVTFAQGTSPTFAIAGGMSLVAGTVWSATGAISFTATSGSYTVTTNGVTINTTNFGFSGAGGTWTLGSSLTLNTSTSTLGVSGGTFNTGNYNVTTWFFSSSNTNTRTINLGSSTFTVTGSLVNNYINLGTITNLTFNAGTSTIVCSSTSGTLNSGGLTFYNVSFTTTTATTHTITGINTLQALTVTAPAAAGVTQLVVSGQQTFNGALGTTGTAGNRRVWFRSATYGISYDLVVNSAPSLTDADFRGIYVRGTSAPISGTRIGNRGECRGITFSTAKTVYWNLAGAQNWSANGWATTSTGAPSTDNFPLPQDTATFTDAGSVTGTITLDTAIGYVPNVDMSGRTSAMTLGTSNATTVYGNWTNGSGTSFTGTATLTFSGGTTQTIISAGRVYTCSIDVNTYGGIVSLGDALVTNVASSINGTLTITTGTFQSNNYSFNVASLNSSGSVPRSIFLGSSAVTLRGSTPFNLNTTALTFDISVTSFTCSSGTLTFNGLGLTFYDVTFSATGVTSSTINGLNTFRNLTITGPTSSGIATWNFSDNQRIYGTLSASSASANRRIFFASNSFGTSRVLDVQTLSTTNCDFRDIKVIGSAQGSSQTRAGDLGGNTGIVFPSSKTVYANVFISVNTTIQWGDITWGTSAGGGNSADNFPLAQDTAIFFDYYGTPGRTLTVNFDYTWAIGTLDFSARTSSNPVVFNTSSLNAVIHKDLICAASPCALNLGLGGFSFQGRDIQQTLTPNGVGGTPNITISGLNNTVVQTSALNLSSFTLTQGAFDASSYNVTLTGSISITGTAARTLNMGSATWTTTASSIINATTTANLKFNKGTSNLVFSFAGGASNFTGNGLHYPKITLNFPIAHTFTITGNNTFDEIASTSASTVTIALGTTSQTFGKWSASGALGKVLTLTGTGTGHVITGPPVSGIDYLAMGSIAFSNATSSEFYAGANSTGTAGAPVYRTAAPAARTLYWVGGTGNWSDTARWSTSSGGGGGSAVPTSFDDVIFDASSNGTSYTATVDVVARCKTLNVAGPASGSVTFAGSSSLLSQGNITFPAANFTRTFTGAIYLKNNTSGNTLTTNGVSLDSLIVVQGINSSWGLGSSLNTANAISLFSGEFNLNSYSLTASSVGSNFSAQRSLICGSSTITLTGTAGLDFGTIVTAGNYLTLNSGSSVINFSNNGTITFNGQGKTFYNVATTGASPTQYRNFAVVGANLFNNLTIAGSTNFGYTSVGFDSDIVISGTLSVTSGANGACRVWLLSSVFGTPRNITCAIFSGSNVDFRDIYIRGGAVPASGTRLGDGGGNSGITFTTASTVYWNRSASGNWSSSDAWALSPGGVSSLDYFPLSQDVAIFDNTLTSGGTVTIDGFYLLPTMNMSSRTNPMTVAISTNNQFLTGDWINSSSVSLTGTGQLQFGNRTNQNITSAGVNFPFGMFFGNSGNTITLQDAFSCSGVINHSFGQFKANNFNVTLSNQYNSNNTNYRSIDFGNGTWTFTGSGTTNWLVNASNLAVTGSATLSFTSASAKTFTGAGLSYGRITLNQGGAGALTITGSNILKTITNTYKATGSTSILLTAGTTQTLANGWNADGESTRVLSVNSTTTSPAQLLFSASGKAANSDYLSINSVIAFSVTDTWYAGANSTNAGSFGWYFSAAALNTYYAVCSEFTRINDSITAVLPILGQISESTRGSDSIQASPLYTRSIQESTATNDVSLATVVFNTAINQDARGTDSTSAVVYVPIINSDVSESIRISDVDVAKLTISGVVQDSVRVLDNVSSRFSVVGLISEQVRGADQISALAVMRSNAQDTVRASDTLSGRVTFLAQFIDGVRESETVSSTLTARGAVSEQVRASDLISTTPPTLSSSVSDTVRTSENFSTKVVLRSSVSDTVRTSENFSTKVVFRSSVSDTVRVSDSSASKGTFLRVVLDTVRASESQAVGLVIFSARLSETAQIRDTNSARFIARGVISEFVRASDSLNTIVSFRASVIDQTRAFEAISTKAVFNSATNNQVRIADTNVGFIRFPTAISDTVRISDATAAKATFKPLVSETVRGSDAVSTVFTVRGSVNETVRTADTTRVAPSIFNAPFVESARGSETVSTKGVFVSTVANNVTAQDTMTVAASTFNASFAETVRGADTTVGFITFPTNVSESAQGADSDVGFLVRTGAIAESAQGADQFAARATFVVAFADTVRAADTMTVAPSVFNAAFVETVRVSDVPNNTAVLRSSVTESILVYDAVLGVYQWNPIPTDQPGNWQAIPTDASGSWQAIDTNQSGGWQLIPTSQGAGWQLIDDSQDPQWQNILTVPN